MRVLLVSNSYPRDLRTYVSGSFQRMRMFVDAIKQIADVDLLFYVAPDIDVSPAAIRVRATELSRYWDTEIRLYVCKRHSGSEPESKWGYYFAGTGSLFGQPSYAQTSQREHVRAFENCLRLNPDVVFVHRLSAMCPLLLTQQPLPPVLFDLDDVEHLYFMCGIKKEWPLSFKLLKYARLPALLMGERRAIRLASRTFVCSEKDRSYLAGRWRLPGVVSIPNSTTIKGRLAVASEPILLFLGTYWYQPNVQAADFLIGEIWPHVLRAVPSARLILAGSRPEEISAFSKAVPGVEFPGFVDDLEGLYRRSRVVCCPILRGGGTRIKIIEAAAYGKPIVATSIGAEGLDLRDDHELLLRDDAKSFADACIELLGNDSSCERLGSAAYDVAVRHYDRAKTEALIRSQVIAACNEEVASSPRPVDVPS